MAKPGRSVAASKKRRRSRHGTSVAATGLGRTKAKHGRLNGDEQRGQNGQTVGDSRRRRLLEGSASAPLHIAVPDETASRTAKSPLSSPSPGDSSTIGISPNVSDRYQKVGRVGQGTYGVVYKARDRFNGRFVALKRCIPHHESSDGFPLTTLREIHALRLCAPHPNIVNLLHVAVSGSNSSSSSHGVLGGTFLAFEYCSHDLAVVIDRHHQRTRASPFSSGQVKRLIRQLLSAIRYCHERCIIHRDIKMSNLLYHNGDLKLADFGLARVYHKDRLMTANVVSLWYRPPELLSHGVRNYTLAIDMWAVGCIFAELLKGYPLLDGKSEDEQLHKIEKCTKNGTLLDEFCDMLTTEGLLLLTNLIHRDPKARWTATESLQSAYFGEEPLAARVMPAFD